MFDWRVRWQERRYEIARGADADLLSSVRRRSLIGLALVVLALLLGLVCFKLHLAGTLKAVAIAIIAVLFVVGGGLAAWARAERDFLYKPDPEEPPSILKG